jgi:hypothetical protein
MDLSRLPNSDRLFGVAAFLISMGTFFVYIYEARLLQKQQYASALPYLEMWNSGGNLNYRLLLVNNGVGPAFIEEIRVHYQGKVYKMDHVAFYNKVRGRADTFNIINTNLKPGQVIPAGREIELFKSMGSPQGGENLRRLFGDNKAQIEIVYASVYEEKWRVKGLQDPPQQYDE